SGFRQILLIFFTPKIMSNSPFASVIGLNFSDSLQSTAKKVQFKQALSQITGTGVGVVKMFNYTETAYFSALIDAGLQVLPAIPNDTLSILSKTSHEEYQTTVNNIITVLQNGGTQMPFICVGNEPFGSWHGGKYVDVIVPAVQNIQKEITKAQLKTKVTVPFNFSIMGASYPPSKGAFGAQSAKILEICKVLLANESIFMINVYPFITHLGDPKDISIDYCLFTSPGTVVTDGAYKYQNIFDAMYDALYVALDKHKYGKLPIVIGEAGWPTVNDSQYPEATIQHAQTFNQNLINHCLSGKGTPRVPNIQIPCFLFEMYDEDLKPGADYETHWGVYEFEKNTDGNKSKNINYKAKYTLDWKGSKS
ncbi:MAG: glycosyl hydrolase family 17 protein, partial [Saprospiraceae bacterium]|nr:glycosyl hydrolase family 17 protein [Saprospiraceae bacterium]